MSFLEEDVESLERSVDELRAIVDHIASKVQKESEPHSDFCINYETELLEKYNHTSGSCRCMSQRINDFLNLKRIPILTEDQINQAKEVYKAKNRERAAKRRKKKAKKK